MALATAHPQAGSATSPSRESVSPVPGGPGLSPGPVSSDSKAPALSWPDVLERLRANTRASAVIAMNAEGLVIGSVGALTLEEGDELAAHIGRAFDLLNGLKKIGGKAESVCAMYSPERTWLTATRFSAPSGARITIGIVGPYTLIRQDRMRVRNAFFRLFDADLLPDPAAPASTPPGEGAA